MDRKLDKLLTPNDVAAIMPMGRDKILQMFHLPDFPKIQINNRYFVKESSLAEWLERNEGKKIKLTSNSKKKSTQKQKGDD